MKVRDPVTPERPDALVIGGGAAGVFGALALAEARPGARVVVLERAREALGKVRISGGGRCNVTHHLFDPALLAQGYPRGAKALRGPLSRFGPRETVAWFAARGVALKTEPDGRMFPVTDRSQTIVACLLEAARNAGVEVRTQTAVTAVAQAPGGFRVTLKGGEGIHSPLLLLATGSSPQGHRWAEALGHTVVPPVPSLFTFNVTDPHLAPLAGVSVPDARVRLEGTKLEQRGPLLLTHWGFSGPAVLKLSAWGARELHARGYQVALRVAWVPEHPEALRERLRAFKADAPRKLVRAHTPLPLPARLWAALTARAGVEETRRWAELSNRDLGRLADELGAGRFWVTGKGVFKEEFVTCGGVALGEVDFKTMASRRVPGLYLAGEVLDIDGVTGGFNFQNAWTTGYLAGRAMAEALAEGGANVGAVTSWSTSSQAL
ncbi:NAD(P)/FAD-dependent oxidoreductase [Truepera radiovictrix]|nr:NAD(P)/FAD-dependent oxidoreductase [Truepera radiovictrix]WMT58855.1 NAD(P)/FAD-dependent oxidoreductase [Truepera radiovictrix]